MKYLKKYAAIFFCSILFVLIALFGTTKVNTTLPLPSFLLNNPNTATTEKINIYDAGSGEYYVFLPSYAELSQLTISYSPNSSIFLDDILLQNGMCMDDFCFEVPYRFVLRNHEIGTLWIYKSQNVATMYIDTATGNMERIHNDKNYEETVSIKLYTPDGIADYSDDRSLLKGRGNSTFENPKRPYLLKLSSVGNLMGMGSATNWILLANANDETNLNNKLVLDLAAQIGLPGTPDSRWVNVYLNGEYNGLYLLTEKIEVHENRLNINTNSGDFLCNIDLDFRWETLSNPFTTDASRTVEIIFPKSMTTSEMEAIMQSVDQMESELLSGADLRKSSIIDLDSWVYRYLIDEISANIDSDVASSYFYRKNGVFYAGPVWDYDMAFGNSVRNQQPHAFVAKNHEKASYLRSPYYSTLYNNDSFYNRLKEIYRDTFRPLIQQMISEQIDDYATYIHTASQMDNIRWEDMFTNLQIWRPGTVRTSAELKNYLSNRILFLDSVWIDDEKYCTVQLESPLIYAYWNISVKQGTYLKTDYMDITEVTWYDAATGQPVDLRQPILTDMTLTQMQITNTVSASYVPSTKDYVIIFSIAVLLSIMLLFITIDTMQRRKEKSCADERNQTNISPRI